MMQCKHIADEPVLLFLQSLGDQWGTWFDFSERSVMRAMPKQTPPKLACAKMRGMIRRGLVSGCGCGCRGDYELTDKGRAAIAAAETERG